MGEAGIGGWSKHRRGVGDTVGSVQRDMSRGARQTERTPNSGNMDFDSTRGKSSP
jgi:hypothetical protein